MFAKRYLSVADELGKLKHVDEYLSKCASETQRRRLSKHLPINLFSGLHQLGENTRHI